MKINIMTMQTAPNFHAGQKAPSDIIEILKQDYQVRTTFFDEQKTKNPVKKITKRLKYAYEFIKARLRGEIVILQFPLPEVSNILNKIFTFNMSFLNKKKTIILIHDLNGLRFQDNSLYKREIARLNKVNYIIVHNDIMKKKLKESGVNKKMYSLGIFDYLCNNTSKTTTKKNEDKIKIVYAGNLVKEKSPFIHEISKNNINYILNLYGVGINKDLAPNIIYKGKYSADELPSKLDGDLGLIWDGKADTSDENYQMKNYTKYNNPHKLSCYMAAGLPVIVWEKSAISKFVKDNNIGYTIKKIDDINTLDFSDLKEKAENVKKIEEKVQNGEYTKSVIKKILKDMGEIK